MSQESFARINISDEEAHCISRALYHESRGESYTGKLYVASVILNRVKDSRFPAQEACGVISQRGQFTFDKKKKITDWNSWNLMMSIVDKIREGVITNLPDFLYFHRTDVVGPCTNKPKNRKRVEGNHVFCK